jgi:hypothetical protein
MKDDLPEVPENQVSGKLREIYEDIKLALGVPMVNLIFRHVAPLRGAWNGCGGHFDRLMCQGKWAAWGINF